MYYAVCIVSRNALYFIVHSLSQYIYLYVLYFVCIVYALCLR